MKILRKLFYTIKADIWNYFHPQEEIALLMKKREMCPYCARIVRKDADCCPNCNLRFGGLK